MAGKTKDDDESGTEATESLSDEVAALRRDLQQLVGQVEKVGKAGLGKAVAEGEAFGADVGAELRRLEDEVLRGTRESPWRSLGLAALAGLVLGLILRR
jgi:ElaB/YqjD/DUF883 family membrane-anchored ribosome-binding protein